MESPWWDSFQPLDHWTCSQKSAEWTINNSHSLVHVTWTSDFSWMDSMQKLNPNTQRPMILWHPPILKTKEIGSGWRGWNNAGDYWIEYEPHLQLSFVVGSTVHSLVYASSQTRNLCCINSDSQFYFYFYQFWRTLALCGWWMEMDGDL